MVDLSLATNDNELLCLRLLASMENGTFRTAVNDLCKQDFTFENSGLPTIHGLEHLARFNAEGGFARHIPIIRDTRRFTADVLHIASRGNVVFTERYDHFWDADGRDLMTPRICGIMEMRDGRVAAMREYYDTVCYSQTPTEPNPDFAQR
jgi:limonene-1,2-epoxide hydrolase